MDVGEWLRGLGLGQYEDRFRDNRIDAEVLPQLTADDLREIGVAAVGDRRKLLAAIAALAAGSPSAYVQAHLSTAQPKPLEVSAERRPVAVSSATWSDRRALRPSLTLRTGATWSTRILTKRRRR